MIHSKFVASAKNVATKHMRMRMEMRALDFVETFPNYFVSFKWLIEPVWIDGAPATLDQQYERVRMMAVIRSYLDTAL